tara:strand:- start:189 stop:488 length:300 start_codon:yes stop_codon:yes gene_type:complete
MIERLILKFSRYKQRYSKQFENIFNLSSKATYDMFDNSKKRIELEKIKIELKKKYFDLGLYVAKQYLRNGHSDFTVDEKFIKLNNAIKEKIQNYKKNKN